VGEEELWVGRESRADDEGRKGFVGVVKARDMEKAPASCNRHGVVLPFEIIDCAFPDFKEAKGIAVGHVVRKSSRIREGITGPKWEKPGERNNYRAILEVRSIPKIKAA